MGSDWIGSALLVTARGVLWVAGRAYRHGVLHTGGKTGWKLLAQWVRGMEDERHYRVAIADCGTNTFTLHVARITSEGWTTVFQQRRFVRLGADSFRTGRLAPDRMRRGWDALASFREAALNLGATHFRAIGCSALRDAANAKDFLQQAAEIGWQVEVIEGQREADWIHQGVADTVPDAVLGDRTALTLDIGGGSVECVVWNRDGVLGRHSLDIGVARLTDWIKPSDPLTAKDLTSLRRVVDAALATCFEQVA